MTEGATYKKFTELFKKSQADFLGGLQKLNKDCGSQFDDVCTIPRALTQITDKFGEILGDYSKATSIAQLEPSDSGETTVSVQDYVKLLRQLASSVDERMATIHARQSTINQLFAKLNEPADDVDLEYSQGELAMAYEDEQEAIQGELRAAGIEEGQ